MRRAQRSAHSDGASTGSSFEATVRRTTPLIPAAAAAARGDAEAVAVPADAIEVGRVVGAWGVKGGIKVKPHAAQPQALFATKRWYLLAPETQRGPFGPQRAAAAPDWPVLLRISQAREQGDHVVAIADGFVERDAAQALAGARLMVSRTSFPTPNEDEFYWVDLIGLRVRNREGVELGQVIGLIETGPTCVLRVVQDDAARPAAGATDECLIPFVSVYVDRVDLPGLCVHVDWQPGD